MRAFCAGERSTARKSCKQSSDRSSGLFVQVPYLTWEGKQNNGSLIMDIDEMSPLFKQCCNNEVSISTWGILANSILKCHLSLTSNHSCVLPRLCTCSCCRVGKEPPQRSSDTCQNDRISLAIGRLRDKKTDITKPAEHLFEGFSKATLKLYMNLWSRSHYSLYSQKIKYVIVPHRDQTSGKYNLFNEGAQLGRRAH